MSILHVFQRTKFAFILPGVMLLLCSLTSYSQDSSARRGSVEQVIVHGKGLEHNLSGDSPDREVSVYLPPGYKTSANKRYPVVYFLHGFTDNNKQWYGVTKHWINLPEVVNKAFRDPQVKEMIIVTPNAYTRFQGSMYSNSITTGDWENFIARELVAYVEPLPYHSKRFGPRVGGPFDGRIRHNAHW